MAQQKMVPIQTLSEMLSDLGYHWHSPDYYISGYEIIHPSRSTAAFRPDFYGLILCAQGWLDLTVNSELIHIGPYHFFAGGPNLIFQRTGQSSDCKTKAIYFTRAFLLRNHVNVHQLEAFDFFAGKFNSCIALTEKDAEPLMKLYAILIDKREGTDAEYHLEIIRSLFLAYVYEAALIYQKKGNTVPKKYTRAIDLVYQFQQLLTKYCTSEHHLQFYAESLFISDKYLIHVIKESTGKTPGKLIDEAIVAEAKIYLGDKRRSIARIAEELHFSDQASFSKFFKKHTGLTPSAFREKP